MAVKGERLITFGVLLHAIYNLEHLLHIYLETTYKGQGYRLGKDGPNISRTAPHEVKRVIPCSGSDDGICGRQRSTSIPHFHLPNHVQRLGLSLGIKMDQIYPGRLLDLYPLLPL